MFALFTRSDYQGPGGWDDLVGAYPTVAEAVGARDAIPWSDCIGRDEAQLVDLDTGALITRWDFDSRDDTWHTREDG